MHRNFLAPRKTNHRPPARPRTDCRRFETRTPTKYVADMSSGAAGAKLIAENTTKHVLRAATDKILSEHTAPSSGPMSVG